MRLLILLNIFFIFLLRYLIKHNRAIKIVGVFSLFFQFLIIISFPFRDRSIIFNVQQILTIFFLLSLIPLVIPIVIHKFLGETRKKALKDLEEKVNNFTYTLIYQIQQLFHKSSFYKKVEKVVTRSLTEFFLKLILPKKELVFLLFIGIPWWSFILAFYLDFYNQSFHLSIYLLICLFYYNWSFIVYDFVCSKKYFMGVFQRSFIPN